MPSGQSSTSTTKVDAPKAVNQNLQTLFTSLFGGGGPGGAGGLASGAGQTLMGIMGGSTLSNNINQIYGNLAANSQSQLQAGIGRINQAAGMTGTRFSTDTASQIGSFQNQYLQGLNQQALQGGMQLQGQQASVAENLMGIFSNAANQYYSPGQTTSSKTMQTGPGAWASDIAGVAGDVIGGAM